MQKQNQSIDLCHSFFLKWNNFWIMKYVILRKQHILHEERKLFCYSNLTIICWMLYACMRVCLLMKGSVSFDLNNTKFTQKIDECSGCVIHYILLKTMQNWLKKINSLKWGRSILNYGPLGARFFSRVSICWPFTGHLLTFLSLWGSLFFYFLPNVVCMYVCVCLFVCYKKGSVTFDPNNATFIQKIDNCMGPVIT